MLMGKEVLGLGECYADVDFVLLVRVHVGRETMRRFEAAFIRLRRVAAVERRASIQANERFLRRR